MFIVISIKKKKMLLVLSSVPLLKQQFNELKNGRSETNRDQKSKNFDSNLLKIDKKYYKGINIYYTWYITIKKIDDCENIYNVNPLYLLANDASEYIEEKDGNIYFIFYDSVNKNNTLLNKFANVWDGIKNEIKAINGGGEKNYRKDYMKIKSNSDDNLPLNNSLKYHAVAIIIRSVFEEGGKLYAQGFLDDCLYEL